MVQFASHFTFVTSYAHDPKKIKAHLSIKPKGIQHRQSVENLSSVAYILSAMKEGTAGIGTVVFLVRR